MSAKIRTMVRRNTCHHRQPHPFGGCGFHSEWALAAIPARSCWMIIFMVVALVIGGLFAALPA